MGVRIPEQVTDEFLLRCAEQCEEYASMTVIGRQEMGACFAHLVVPTLVREIMRLRAERRGETERRYECRAALARE